MIYNRVATHSSFTDFAKFVDELEEKNKTTYSIFQKTFSHKIKELIKHQVTSKEKKHYYSLILYNTVLLKNIDLIGKNTEEKELIVTLNQYYDTFYKDFCKMPTHLTTYQLLENEFYSTFFLDSCKFLTPLEILQKKQIADTGYCMKEELNKWFEEAVLDNKASLSDLIQKYTDEFLVWAETHPKAASFLVSDIALTCSILLEQEALDRFLSAVNAMTVTRLFLDSLGISPEYEPIEKDGLLKFKALADLITYFPKIATAAIAVKKATEKSQTMTSWILNAVKSTTFDLATQKITRLIPQGQEKLVILAAQIIRGDEMQKIVAHQRNLSLVQLAGNFRSLLKDPNELLIDLEVWFKSIFKATGQEKIERIAVQLVLPLLEAIFFAFCLYFGFKKSLFFKSLNLILAPILIYFPIFLSSLIDEETGFEVKRAVKNKIMKQQEQKEKLFVHYLLSTDPKIVNQIKEESRTYISDLQKHYALPKALPAFAQARSCLKQEGILLLEQTKQIYLKKLNRYDESLDDAPKASDLIVAFNTIVDLKKIRLRLKNHDETEIDTIAFAVAEDLIELFLAPKLSQVFKGTLLDLYRNNEIGNIKCKSPKKFLEQQLKEKSDVKDAGAFLKMLKV